jgi:hypothetical protein
MYLIFAIMAGVIGACCRAPCASSCRSRASRSSTASPMVYGGREASGLDAGKHMYNVFITAHG